MRLFYSSTILAFSSIFLGASASPVAEADVGIQIAREVLIDDATVIWMGCSRASQHKYRHKFPHGRCRINYKKKPKDDIACNVQHPCTGDGRSCRLENGSAVCE